MIGNLKSNHLEAQGAFDNNDSESHRRAPSVEFVVCLEEDIAQIRRPQRIVLQVKLVETAEGGRVRVHA